MKIFLLKGEVVNKEPQFGFFEKEINSIVDVKTGINIFYSKKEAEEEVDLINKQIKTKRN